MLSDLKRIIDQICRDRGFDKKLLIEAIEEAVQSAAKKKLGSRRDIEVRYNEEFGEVEVFQFRSVVEKVEDEQTEIALADAKILDPEVQLDDELGEKMENIEDLGRIAAQSAKQVIIHKMKDAERDVIYEMFKDRKGEIVGGIVQRFERGNMIVNLGRTDAILPKDQQIPKRSFKQGDRIRAYLLDVRQNSRDSQILLSRTCDDFLAKLFAMEVPEIAEDIVKIMGVSREPGFRAKIAVSSTETDVDPVGACVGMKGSRVQNVVQELQGERIDIVPWSPDPAKYVYNALAPAHVSMVMVDEEEHTLFVVVPNDQLSLAIGRQGQNVRLASKLLGWRIDVKSEQRYANLEDPTYQALLTIKGIEEALADQLLARGIVSVEKLAAASVEDLTVIRSINDEQAQYLIETAKKMVEKGMGTANLASGEKKTSGPEEDGAVKKVSDETEEAEKEVESVKADAVVEEEQSADDKQTVPEMEQTEEDTLTVPDESQSEGDEQSK
ncbi:MAG: transcription termination factor NusA [Proteobacteria bacterium]|nr:transcription termination factor NusA [Pseudomonadota bacterium]MBU1233246.1 transcription termination factor NusA [Pseudomonadota bacterium]MBU1417507.1 transcription termination factor NusA [Pseudomonadota bacterium]MBU1456196.1 transcription termination factor NusA [Pseudomonadota bacterium]